MSDSAIVQGKRNLADTVRRSAQRCPDKIALRWQDHTASWADLDDQVDAVARGLRALQVPDTAGYPARVAIALPNVPEFVQSYFGVLRAGLIAVPISPGYTRREMHYLLADSGSQIMMGTADVLATISEIEEQLPVRYTYTPTGGVDAPWVGLATPGPPVSPSTGDEDLAVLLYTSGTEGQPKGAMLSHRALLANNAQLADIQPSPFGPDDVVLLALPLFHAYGLNSGLGCLAHHGATGVLVERFDPLETLRLIAEHHVTTVIGVPSMYVAWSLMPDFGEAFASVRLAASGAAPLDAATGTRFLAATGHPIFEGYGLTETGPVLTSTLASLVPKPGSIGRAIPGVSIKLVGPDGNPVAEDEGDEEAPGSPGTDPGEIVVRGENVFHGYWPDGRGGPDGQGWWATGDVAYADGDGDLFLVDRLRELILVRGFNVYPYEVEQVLQTHPAVTEAAVIGAPHPYTGQTVKAYVVAGAPISAEELHRHCERNLARFKCPTAIELVPALPHTATGKVRKAALNPAGSGAQGGS